MPLDGGIQKVAMMMMIAKQQVGSPFTYNSQKDD